MKKRKKVIEAGTLRIAAAYTPPAPCDPEHIRAAKSRATTAARKALNLKAAYRRLELLLEANFTPADFMVTLTYRPKDLPPTRKNQPFCHTHQKPHARYGNLLSHPYT